MLFVFGVVFGVGVGVGVGVVVVDVDVDFDVDVDVGVGVGVGVVVGKNHQTLTLPSPFSPFSLFFPLSVMNDSKKSKNFIVAIICYPPSLEQ